MVVLSPDQYRVITLKYVKMAPSISFPINSFQHPAFRDFQGLKSAVKRRELQRYTESNEVKIVMHTK